ncbi:Asp-tRNA(Asn)/Glu-tRNA(Gln) amidotransferase subunit GatC [Stomatohabitans albus]|uniref:Asp-tRNA(Asn)/Glu-tRNA(Gln) amidotransferase subunit GatC n=1 Tax=Stomatohabitans albus TaxID=3110766 RepID=UPI00300CF4D2
MALTEAQTAHVAKLAMLALSDDEIHTYAQQLDEILTYAQTIAQAPGVDDVEPTANPFRQVNVWREDTEIGEPLSRDDVLLNAPAVEAEQFRVPRIIGEE